VSTYVRAKACRCGGKRIDGECDRCGSGWRCNDGKSKHAAMYASSRWLRLRLLFLAEHPLCVECERQGKIVSAVDVDHITPHGGDWGLFLDRANLQGLCKACHGVKTRSEGGARA
jgi:5-methylcytosine-specific restriction endonuclease McrA